jgi:hypothetical protein
MLSGYPVSRTAKPDVGRRTATREVLLPFRCLLYATALCCAWSVTCKDRNPHNAGRALHW